MKKYSVIFGVDISKLKLDIVGLNQVHEIVSDYVVIENTKKSITTFIKKYIKKYGKEHIVFAFENTGVYGYHLGLVLTQLEIDYYNISALEIKRSMGIRRGKTDKSDSLMIAKYILSNHFDIELSSLPDSVFIELKLLYSQREKIVKTIKSFGCNKETKAFLGKKEYKTVKKTTESIVKSLQKNLKVIEQKIEEVITQDEKLKKTYNLVKSVPGVGPQTATYLLIVTRGFTCFNSARKLACYSGVAPFPFQSGSSVNGRTKVNHMADKKLKSLLSMCALNSKRFDYQMKTYFDKKVAEGKNKMLIINNIRNKVLQRIFAVVKRGTPYVNTCAYAS